MPKVIRRPKKVCTVNKYGKKKCFTIQARRRLNPESYQESREKLLQQIQTIVESICYELTEFVDQTWATPMSNEILEDHYKALVMLSKNVNNLIFKMKTK